MRILLIGDKNLRNQSICEIIWSKRNIEVEHITPGSFSEGSGESNGFDTSYQVTLLDLASFGDSPEQTVKIVSSTIQTEKLIVSHIFKSQELIEPLLQNGAHDYLPWDVLPEELLANL